MKQTLDEETFVTQLRKCNLRATNQRLAIMQVMMESHSHPSAEDVFLQLKHSHPTLSLSTVYKTLQIMAEMGVLLTIDTGIGSQRFDGQVYPHHHAVCVRCGKVYDVDFGKFPVKLDSHDILPGFNVQTTKITFSGTCQVCESLDKRDATTGQSVPSQWFQTF